MGNGSGRGNHDALHLPVLQKGNQHRDRAALFDTVFMSRKICDQCGRGFLLVNDVPMTQEQYDRRVNDSSV